MQSTLHCDLAEGGRSRTIRRGGFLQKLDGVASESLNTG